MMTRVERPLSDEEQSQLKARLANASTESIMAFVKTGAASAAVCGVLAIVTLVASTAPRAFVIAFWALLWLVFTLWIGLPWRRLMRGQTRTLAEALRTNRAREIRMQTTRVVEFEEEEDEGACYAFDRDGSSTIFIVGQEFYEDVDFPNSDFSITEILGSGGLPVDVLVAKHGRKLVPERVVPARVKKDLGLPGHLEVVETALDQIESALPQSRHAR